MTNKQRQVRLDDFGAWLIKGNADSADLVDRFAGDPHVTRWCVRPSYRLDLMRAGQPVLFWASGCRRRDIPYGIWGLGKLTGLPGPHGPEDQWSVPLSLIILDPPHRLTREALRADPRLTGLEVLRQPQAANPSFATSRQFAAIRDRLPSPSANEEP